MRGVFISFEGPEGSGKSTQIRILAQRLTAGGLDVVVTREPGGTAIGERIRDILMDRGAGGITAETEALLMTAARAQHVHEVIAPALARNAIVICDRYLESTLAYQGGGRRLSLQDLRQIQQFATGGIAPDLRVLLDLPVEVGLQRRLRASGTTNRLDEEDVGFHRRVRTAYHDLAAEYPAGWAVVDADATLDEVAGRIWNVVSAFLSTRQPVPGEHVIVAI